MAPLFFYSSPPPPAESLGNKVGRLTFIFLSSWGLEAHTTLRNGCRCHWHCDFRVCGLVPWHLWGPPQSTCVATIYGLNSGVFLSTLLHMPYPNQGVVWRSVQCLHAYYPACCLFFCSPGYVHLYVSPSLKCGLFSPPDGMRIDYEGALSRRLHVLT